MSFDLGPDTWRGEHLITVPRAPKPEPGQPPKGFVPDAIRSNIHRLAREGKSCPQIARELGLMSHMVRNLLLRDGVDFVREKNATNGKVKR